MSYVFRAKLVRRAKGPHTLLKIINNVLFPPLLQSWHTKHFWSFIFKIWGLPRSSAWMGCVAAILRGHVLSFSLLQAHRSAGVSSALETAAQMNQVLYTWGVRLQWSQGPQLYAEIERRAASRSTRFYQLTFFFFMRTTARSKNEMKVFN